MSNACENTQTVVRYEIRIRGHLDPAWRDWFDHMQVTALADGETVLRGNIADQSALYGVIRRLRDLGLPLISINPVLNSEEEYS